MTSNTYSSEFIRYPARRVTIVEYRRRGGIWRVTSGVLMRAPQFNYIIGAMMSLTLHSDTNADWNTVSTHFDLSCNDYVEPSFEVVADGSLAILRGFRNNGYETDVFLHGRTS